MTRLYLIRHGETVYNAKRKVQGSMDIPLSDKGVTQARKVAKRFKNTHIDLIFTSELVRAQQTAYEISKVTKRPVLVDHHFNEMDFGMFEGMTFEQIVQEHPDLWELREKNKLKYTGHKGESLISFRNRVMKPIDQILDRFPDGDIAIVSHGGTNRLILCALLGFDMKRSHLIRQDNVCINVLDVKKKGRTYLVCTWSINDTFHLDPTGKFPRKRMNWR